MNTFQEREMRRGNQEVALIPTRENNWVREEEKSHLGEEPCPFILGRVACFLK